MDRTTGFGVYLDRTLKKIQSAYLKAFETHSINLTIEQWVILQRIHMLGEEASQSAVVKTNYRNRASTSRVISGLCSKGLVIKERFSGDQKQYRLSLTANGQAIIAQAEPVINQLRYVATQNISEKEFDIFLKVLNRLWENYDRQLPIL